MFPGPLWAELALPFCVLQSSGSSPLSVGGFFFVAILRGVCVTMHVGWGRELCSLRLSLPWKASTPLSEILAFISYWSRATWRYFCLVFNVFLVFWFNFVLWIVYGSSSKRILFLWVLLTQQNTWKRDRCLGRVSRFNSSVYPLSPRVC
jgi:hypothetical protein